MSHSIRLERFVEADPLTVFALFTSSGQWLRWQGIACALDARLGGVLEVTMPNGMVARGAFRELVPGRRVVFTWGWVGHPSVPPGSTTVEIDLRPEGSGTRLVLTHRDLPSSELPLHQAGWLHYLGRQAVTAAGGDAGPDPGLGEAPRG